MARRVSAGRRKVAATLPEILDTASDDLVAAMASVAKVAAALGNAKEHLPRPTSDILARDLDAAVQAIIALSEDLRTLRYASGIGGSATASRRQARRRVAVRYPDISVSLSGEDGNAFGILGRVTKALRRAGVPKDEIDEFYAEATAGDYDHLLQTVMRWVEWD
jgi:hypothetical protein